jgi:hypothetical protein
MSNPWDKPKRSYNRSSKVNTFSGSWRDVPWASLYKECQEVQAEAVQFEEQANEQRYKDWIANEESVRADLNPEGGAYEGNIGDEHPYRPLTGTQLINIKAKASTETIEKFVDLYQFKSFSIQLMTEIIKHISQYKLSTIDGNDYDPIRLNGVPLGPDGRPVAVGGQISSRSLFRQVFADETMLGLYNFLMLDFRSSYLEKQYTGPNKSWCALVPLIASAFKLHHSIPYSHWNMAELVGVTNPKLYQAMTWQPEEFSREAVIEARTEGLLIKSGKGLGTYRNPLYTFKLYGTTGLSGIPEYVQTMLAQIWCAHPQNRSRLMVLDWVNWDRIPEELISTEVIGSQKPQNSSPYSRLSLGSEPADLPWDT